MITTEELNLEGKWWLPDRDNEIRIGNLTLNQLHKHGVLSIYGSFSGTREAAIILGELSEEKAKRLEQMTKHCFDASLKERVAAVYHEYADVADSLFFFKGEEEFSKKVKDTRN